VVYGGRRIAEPGLQIEEEGGVGKEGVKKELERVGYQGEYQEKGALRNKRSLESTVMGYPQKLHEEPAPGLLVDARLIVNNPPMWLGQRS